MHLNHFLPILLPVSHSLPMSHFPFRDSHRFSKQRFKQNPPGARWHPPSIQYIQQMVQVDLGPGAVGIAFLDDADGLTGSCSIDAMVNRMMSEW